TLCQCCIYQCCSLPTVRRTLPFFFSMLCHPPIYTFFPYTTLFRSSPRIWRRLPSRWSPTNCFRPRGLLLSRTPCPSPKSCSACLDRKSTRLNSSHVAISYAVFCLKKKKDILRCQQSSRKIEFTTHA